jgi:hypothetical protein
MIDHSIGTVLPSGNLRVGLYSIHIMPYLLPIVMVLLPGS